MKAIKNIFYGLGIVLMASSCSEDYLDIYPPQIIDKDYFTTVENAEMAVIGCYDVIAWDGDHNTLPFFFGDIIGRDGHKGGDVGGDQEWMDSFINFTYDNTETMIDKAWRNYYIGIGRCNVVLENVAKMSEIDEETRHLLLAEARFIRGYFYFELVKTFGEVPLINHVLEPSEYTQNKASEEAIYQLIENDFAWARKHLPTRNNLGESNYGRATQGAADALRAKAYIYQQKWEKAKQLTDSIINVNPQYSLLNNYADVFKLNNEHSAELIFEIEFQTSGDGSFGDENEGSMLSVYMTTRNHPFAGIGGWGFNCPTQEFVNEFEAGDERLEATVIRDGETLWAGTDDEATFDTKFASNLDSFNNEKYALPASQQGNDPYDTPKNWIVIRYAEVLLWNAEAAVHTGGDWQTPLQMVRDRANMGPTPIADPLKAVYHERRVELGMEGHRFWDVVRQGRGTEVYGAFGYIEGTHNHLPIPQNQIDLNGGAF